MINNWFTTIINNWKEGSEAEHNVHSGPEAHINHRTEVTKRTSSVLTKKNPSHKKEPPYKKTPKKNHLTKKIHPNLNVCFPPAAGQCPLTWTAPCRTWRPAWARWAWSSPQSEVIMITTAQAPKIYPIHLLMTTNYRLPNDADRWYDAGN